ncbi:hypothetical protein NA57DRAFT_45110, partial [Rhizodiscina lignyota]
MADVEPEKPEPEKPGRVKPQPARRESTRSPAPSPHVSERAQPEEKEHDYSDDEDLLGEEYIADLNRKFERERAVILARKIDLSQPEYRSTSPLARIALLDSLTPADLPFKAPAEEPSSVPSPTVIQQPITSSTTPLPSVERPQTDLLTPKEEQEDVTMEDAASPVVRTFEPPPPREEVPRTPTPELTSLPFLAKGPPSPVSDPDQQTGTQLDDDSKVTIVSVLASEHKAEAIHREELRVEYAERYRQWRRNAQALRRKEQEEVEAKQRAQKLAEKTKTPEPDPATAALPLPTPTEGRRSHRFASQLDWEIAIQASLETAKEDQAKQEREAQKVQADLEKEAEIPPMASHREIVVRRFHDTNQARRPERAIEIFDFVPPEDDFTEEEHNILVAGYKSEPKAWGKIAQSLPGRTYKDCINHYYATKWSTDYKSLKDRRRKALRGRARALRAARSNALISGLGAKDDDELAPAVTETGRPKRLAAPTFGEKDATDDAMLAGATARKLAVSAAEHAIEKAGKRAKVAKEKGTRKAKNQPLAARPAISPTKLDKDRKERGLTVEPGDPSAAREGVEKWPIMPTTIEGPPSALGTGVLGPVNDLSVLHERPAPAAANPAIVATTERPRAHSGHQRAGASSYWSVQEQNDFKRYVVYYGTDFLTISSLLGTKTNIMVKNFFERKKVEGSMAEAIQAAYEADEKRARGEPMGAPPTPTAARRRIESVQPTAPRALAPNPDAMQIDHHSPPSLPKTQPHTSPPQSASSKIGAAAMSP